MITYSLEDYVFDLAAFFPMSLFDRITDVRVRRHQVILQEAARRKRRTDLAPEGRLVLLAADHPARMLTAVGENPIAMGDRQQYLGRILRIVTVPGVDGIIATTDVIEDLLIINALVREAGGPSFLDQRVLIGSMNRSGLAGSVWETDDRMTCFTPDSLDDLNLDGGKVVVRICPEEPEFTNRTLEYCAKAISGSNERGLPVFVEPVPVARVNGRLRLRRAVADIVRVMGVASALEASAHEVNLVIACDMPGIDMALVRRMLRESQGYQGVVPVTEKSRIEPMCAVYKKGMLGILNRALDSGERKIKEVLRRCRIKYIEVSDSSPFRNINTTEEYEKYIASRSGIGRERESR